MNVPEADLTELRRRINNTKWPERETVADESQGVRLATIQDLARYWGTDYDWRKIESNLNALPQFITEIDGLDIHFIHVRSKHDGALPIIITHGWPGSIIEQIKIIDPLTNPTAHGGSASDAFHDDEDLDSFVDALVRRLASFDREALGAAKAQLNRLGTPTAGELQSSNDRFFAILASAGAQARRTKLAGIGYGVLSDFELNFGRYLPSFGEADDGDTETHPDSDVRSPPPPHQ